MNLLQTDRRFLAFALLGSVLLHALALAVFDLRFETSERESRVLNVQLVPQSASVSMEQEHLIEELDNQKIIPDSDMSNTPKEPAIQTPTDMREIAIVEAQEKALLQPDRSINQAAPQGSQQVSNTEADSEAAIEQNPIPSLSIQDLVNVGVAIAREQENDENIRNITGDEATNTEEQYYLKAWLKKVQEIGQLNYPQEAVEKKLYGKLRLYVSLNPDGSVEETRVLRSSGHDVLDEAAIHIVELAAPFSPFPNSMREAYDLLEIVREWEFRKEALIPDTNNEED